jgi:hypothetical protein
MAIGAIEVDYPIGCTVHPTAEASRQYIDRFPPDQLATMLGTVIGHSGGSAHVNWDDSFRGHDDGDHIPLPGDAAHTGHCWYLGPSEIVRDNMAGMAIPLMVPEIANAATTGAIPQPVPRLRVTIARNVMAYGNPWQFVITNGPSVTKFEMKAAMDKVIARRIPQRKWNHHGINDIVNSGISDYGIDPQVFVDAITAAVIAKQARESTGTFTSVNRDYDAEISMAMATQPMIVAIGDQMFTLQPRGVISGSRALKITKDRYTKIAKDAVARITIAAKAEADGMIANGERQLRAARVEIERERDALARSVENVMVIPEWIAVNRLKIMKYDGGRSEYNLMVAVEVNTRIRSIQLPRTWYDDPDRERGIHSEIVKWRGRIIDRCHMVTAWMPFSSVTGAFNYGLMRMIEGGDNPWQLPHLGTNRCCMTLQGMPLVMKDYASYKGIVAIINRGNSEINLDSLLHGYLTWHPDVQQQIPSNVKRILDNGGHEDIPESWLDDAERIPVEVEASETFNVDRLREIRTARGESLDSSLGDHLLVDTEDDGENGIDEDDNNREEAANG